MQEVGGVEVALAAASSDVKDALAQGFAELSGTWTEFRWMLGDVQETLASIQVRQWETLALQREQLDLSREQFVKLSRRLLDMSGRSAERREEEPDAVAALPPAGEIVQARMGLRAFQPQDAEYFFGRDDLVAELLARLGESSLLAVVGPSGSGKSSLVRAGLVPALWAGALPASETSMVKILTPGERPLEELAARLALLRGIAPGSVVDDLRAVRSQRPRDPAGAGR